MTTPEQRVRNYIAVLEAQLAFYRTFTDELLKSFEEIVQLSTRRGNGSSKSHSPTHGGSAPSKEDRP
jgi:hypothetical protein